MKKQAKPTAPGCADAMPAPPHKPDPAACCQSGCVPCIFDLYDQAMERYRADLQAWRERQAGNRSRVKAK